MKKLIVLLSLIALIASGMAFAQVTLNGKIEVEVANDFDGDTNAGKTEKWDPDVRIEANIKADDFNTGYIRMRLNDTNLTQADKVRTVFFDRAVFTNDLLGGLGVKGAPVKILSQVGLNEWTPANVATAGWDLGHRYLLKNQAHNDYYFDEALWGIKETISADMFTLGAYFGLQNSHRLQDMFVDAVVKVPAGPGALSVEGAYLLWSNTVGAPGMTGTMLDLGQGVMQFGVAYDMKVGEMPVKVGASYFLPVDTEISYAAYAFNAKVTSGPYYAIVGFQGYPENDDLGLKAEAISNLRVAAGAQLAPFFGVDVGTVFYLGGEQVNKVGDDRETFNTLDVSAYFKSGKTTYRIGYLYVPDDDWSIDPYMTDANVKSFYLTATMAY